MVLPMVVGGFLLTRDTDRGNTDEIMQQVGFNHPEKYEQIHGGPGTGQLVASVQGWKSGIAADFDEVARLLDEANAKAGVAWSGQAAEQHGSSLKPMTQFVLDAKDVSTSVGDSAEQQVQHFGRVKNSMPEPVEVDATDNLLEKGGAWLVGKETDLQRQEREASEKAQEAKQYYEDYDRSTRDVSQNLAYYPKAPEMAFEQGSESYGTNPTAGSMPNASGVPGGGATPGGGGGGVTGGGGGVTGGGGGTTGGGHGSTPAGTGSQWAPSTPTPGAPGLPGGGTGQGVGGGPGLGVGAGMVPGAGVGTGVGAGGGAGAGARGVGGPGAGNGPGAGGRAGAGGLGGASGSGGGAAGAAGRGGAGAAAGAGAAGRGRGQEGDEDAEHENKYMLETDEAWEDLGLPRVAPPVFGE